MKQIKTLLKINLMYNCTCISHKKLAKCEKKKPLAFIRLFESYLHTNTKNKTLNCLLPQMNDAYLKL